MNQPLKILHLEDDADYSDLVRSLLQKEGLSAEVVPATNGAEFIAALEKTRFDVILADYQLPTYDGLQALTIARQKSPDTPFLMVSGTIGEQAAIETLNAGATDYVLKLWPERLVPAVRRAVQEAQEKERRQRIETELIRREKYFRTLTENSLDILTILTRDGIYLYNSPSLKTVLGYEPAELVGRNAFGLVHPDDLACAQKAFEQAIHHPDCTVRLEFRFKHHDGSWSYLEAVGQSHLDDPEISGVVVNSRDASERKRAEASLRESEQQYRLIFDGNPIPMWVFDHDTLRFLEVNDAAVQHYGYSREEFLSMTLRDIRPTEDVPAMLEYLHSLLAAGTPGRMGFAGVWRHRKKDGALIDVEAKWCPISFKGRAASLNMANDITERIRAEEALRSSEMLFHSVWENSVDGMRLTDEKGTIVAVNQAFCRLVGLDRHQLEGKPLTVVYANESEGAQELEHYCAGFRERKLEKPTEQRLLLRNGQTVTLEVSNSFVELRGQSPLQLALFHDVTAQKRLEEQLRQSQKMEAIGQLAGGVAHDFNNILTVIHGHASLLMSGGNLGANSARSAQQVAQAAERAAALTRQLLAFSRRQVIQPRRLDMNEVVGNMTTMLGRLLGEDIALRLSYFPQAAVVEADASMMEQILLNLAVNSRDAMPKGGSLTIKISVVEMDTQQLGRHSETQPGRFVCLSIIDTGCGIPPENLRRIFEPFFTTKEVGRGTGLGLATVYGIVKQHRGWVDVESEVGKGANFKVFLPSPAGANEGVGEAPVEKPVKGGHETILVVEDEAPVRELVCSLLASHGYTILQAESGAKALELWKNCKEKVDLVLTDLVMPDRLNGRELAEKLWADRPGLKVIFTSGYSADVVGKDFVLQRGLNYLQKPYHPNKLASAVRECLDAVN